MTLPESIVTSAAPPACDALSARDARNSNDRTMSRGWKLPGNCAIGGAQGHVAKQLPPICASKKAPWVMAVSPGPVRSAQFFPATVQAAGMR